MIPPWTSVAVITVQGDGWFSRMLTSPNDCFGPSLPTITNLILQPCNSQTLNTTIADKKSSKIRICMLWHFFSKYDCLSGYLLVNRFHQWSHILKDVTFSTSNEDHKWTDLSLLHQHCKYRFKNWIRLKLQPTITFTYCMYSTLPFKCLELLTFVKMFLKVVRGKKV